MCALIFFLSRFFHRSDFYAILQVRLVYCQKKWKKRERRAFHSKGNSIGSLKINRRNGLLPNFLQPFAVVCSRFCSRSLSKFLDKHFTSNQYLVTFIFCEPGNKRKREDGRRKSEKFNQPFRLLPTFVLKCRKPIFCRYCYAASHISHVVVNPDKLLFTVVVVLTRTQWIHVNSGPFKRRRKKAAF